MDAKGSSYKVMKNNEMQRTEFFVQTYATLSFIADDVLGARAMLLPC